MKEKNPLHRELGQMGSTLGREAATPLVWVGYSLQTGKKKKREGEI